MSFDIKDQILKLFKSKLESSSFIMLPNVFKSEYFLLKILWLILSIVSASYCGLLISKSITDYYNFDVITKTEVKYETILKFPVITLCSLNTFNTDYANDYINSHFDVSDPALNSNFYINYLVNYNIRKNLTDSYLFGKSIDQLIIKCRFGVNECILNQDFEHYYDFNFGNCYRFNSGKNMNGEQVEKKYANALFGYFDIELWIGQAQNNYNMLSVDNGLIVFITNENANSLIANGILLSPGYTTKISIERINIIKKPQPYSNCVENLESIDSYNSLTYKKLINQNQNQTYKYINCYLFCIQKHLGDICNCQLDYLNLIYYNEMRLCYLNETTREQDGECFQKSLKMMLNDSITYLKKCDCPFECEYNFFKNTNSFAEFPTRKYLPFLMNSSLIKSLYNYNLNDSLNTFEMLKKSVARLQINYQEMMQTFITEYPKMQAADLVSSVGGILGLFLGLSFLSFIEIIDFLVQFINILVKSVKISRIRKQKQNQVLDIINVKSVD